MKSIKTIIEDISKLRSEEEIRKYCNNLDGYSEITAGNCTSYETDETLFGLVSEDPVINDSEADIDECPDYCLIFLKEDEDGDCDEDYIPDTLFFGINFKTKKVAKYIFSQWDDGDCSEIREVNRTNLSI